MKLDISQKNLVKIAIDELILQCYDSDGNVTFHSLERITELNCSRNRLQSLPKLPKTLKQLYCSNNHLQNLPKLPETLEGLYCSHNHLQNLPDLLPGGLLWLYCSGNQLQSLPELPKTLEGLYCSGNKLRCLPKLPKTLKYMYCNYNQLHCLPYLPETLEELCCSHNPLIFIQPLAERPRLYQAPEKLERLHSLENYSNYYKKQQTYIYLITYLTLQLNVSPVILSHDYFWFPGVL